MLPKQQQQEQERKEQEKKDQQKKDQDKQNQEKEKKDQEKKNNKRRINRSKISKKTNKTKSRPMPNPERNGRCRRNRPMICSAGHTCGRKNIRKCKKKSKDIFIDRIKSRKIGRREGKVQSTGYWVLGTINRNL